MPQLELIGIALGPKHSQYVLVKGDNITQQGQNVPNTQILHAIRNMHLSADVAAILMPRKQQAGWEKALMWAGAISEAFDAHNQGPIYLFSRRQMKEALGHSPFARDEEILAAVQEGWNKPGWDSRIWESLAVIHLVETSTPGKETNHANKMENMGKER